MAEETRTTQTYSTAETQATDNQPTVESLMAQLEAERAEKEKNKTALDKALKEKGEITKALRAKQTTEEQEAEAKRLADEERENMRKELNHIKAVNAYKNISDGNVEKLIDSVSDADHNAIAEIIAKEIKAAVAVAEQEWMSSRPGIGANAYSSMTKEQIMAIPDRAERQKAIAQNLELFK